LNFKTKSGAAKAVESSFCGKTDLNSFLACTNFKIEMKILTAWLQIKIKILVKVTQTDS
jgi:hypothetical protein